MASQNINVGTNADDGTGESLRSAFIDIRKMFAEVYNQTYTSDTQDLSGATFEIDSDQIVDGAIDEVHLNATNTPSANQILQWDGSTGFTWVDQFDGDITGVAAGSGLTGGGDEDDVTLNVGAGTGITVNADDIQISDGGVDTTQLADDGVTHAKLEDRYTEAKTDYGSITSTTTIDWSVAAIHELTMGGAATLNFSNYKKGQAIDLIIDGDETITFGTTSGTPSINQVGTSTYDGTTDNIIQVLCTDDDATPTFLYAVGAYTSDTNPA